MIKVLDILNQPKSSGNVVRVPKYSSQIKCNYAGPKQFPT